MTETKLINEKANDIVWIVNNWLPRGLSLSKEAEKALRGVFKSSIKEILENKE